MAELASGIAEKVLEKLGSLAYEEFHLVLCNKSELRELELTIATIKAVLLDAEEKQASNHALGIWLRQLKDILYDAEDVLGEVECEVKRKQVVTTYGRTSREVLSSSIGTLKHLRYLSLAWNDKIKKLPDSICKLHNLQTLRLNGCPSLERLPKDTRKMISLRHLTVTISYTRLFENGVCCFNSLQLLRISNCPRLEVLFQGMDRWLINLRTLIVDGCERLTSLTLNIMHLTALETLSIENCKELSLTKGEDNWNLKLSLRKLKIKHLPKLEVLPQWLQGSANTLQFLSISKCLNLMALPEWLPSLKSLQTLEIIGCPGLSSLPEGMDRLTFLREMTIKDCPELFKKCKEEDQSKIAHIQTIRLLG